MAGHTSGPWEWIFEDGSWCLKGILIADGENGTPHGDIIDQANARLIAAAPDLLEALKAILHWRVPHDDVLTVTEGSREAIARARAAIAKATGEA